MIFGGKIGFSEKNYGTNSIWGEQNKLFRLSEEKKTKLDPQPVVKVGDPEEEGGVGEEVLGEDLLVLKLGVERPRESGADLSVHQLPTLLALVLAPEKVENDAARLLLATGHLDFVSEL